MKRRELDSVLIAFGFTIGSLIGALVTLWYAPVSGKALIERAEAQVERVQSQVNRAESSLQAGRQALLARRQGSSSSAP